MLKKISLVIGGVILGVFLLNGVSGGFAKIDTVVLTQNGKYIGIKTESHFRFPWNKTQSYAELQIPSSSNGGILRLPQGTFNIYYTIELGEGETMEGVDNP